LAHNAFAAHPLVTEDTATQGAGNAEIENGVSWIREDGTRTFTFAPQLSYGITPALDVLIQPSWLSSRAPGSSYVHGFGDTALDAKWRFYGEAPLSLGIRGGLQLATAQKGLGLPSGTVAPHAVLVATVDAVPWTVHANLGYTRFPRSSGLRRDAPRVSAAVMYAANESWTLSVDVGYDGPTDPARSAWAGKWLAGVIYTVQPGLDIDLGWQKSLRRDLPSTQWLLGVTYRWAP
jgi:hypothetical protein